MTTPVLDEAVALRWIEAWDQQQTTYLPHRQEQFEMVADLIADAVGPHPRLLDLGCGPGALGRVVHQRLPDAQVIGVDHDPLLLALASAHVREGWLSLVDVDLRDPSWVDQVTGPFDAVMAATALHWLPARQLRRTYRHVLTLLRPGGVFVNSDTMPPVSRGRSASAVTRPTAAAGDADAWQQWWRAAELDPALTPALESRAARRRPTSAEFMPPVTWHTEALVRAGFARARVAWRRGTEAVLTAAVD